jgi:hypothetical protein
MQGWTIRNPVFRPQISIEVTLQICSREDKRIIGWATRPISSLIDQVRDRSTESAVVLVRFLPQAGYHVCTLLQVDLFLSVVSAQVNNQSILSD